MCNIIVYQVVYSDSDVEELTKEELAGHRVSAEDDALRHWRTATPRMFARDSWLVTYSLCRRSPEYCIVHRTVGDEEGETFGCSGCYLLGDDNLGECEHILAVRARLKEENQKWDGSALFAPTPAEPEDLRLPGVFRRVYGVFVICGKWWDTDGKLQAPIVAGWYRYPADLPFDPRQKFRLKLAVLSDYHGTYQVVKGNLYIYILMGTKR